MKLKNVLIILFLCICNFAHAGTVIFEEANKLYHNREYKEASNLYMQIINQGYHSCSVYYNAGNSFFKNNQMGMAVWCYEKALQYEPDNQVIKENLLITNTKLSNSFKKTNEWFGIKWIKIILQFHTVNKWSLGSLVFFSLAVLLLFFKKKNKSFSIITFIRRLFWLLFLVYALGAISNYLFTKLYNHGIIIHSTILYNDVQAKGLGEAQITEGIKVRILQTRINPATQENRYLIILPNKIRAWVNAADVLSL
jgi:tetratricopeptide (TPR) repeat protein